MRTAILVSLLVTLAAAEGGRGPLDAAQRKQLVEIIGAETWADLPSWRQRTIEVRFKRFLAIPVQKQAKMRPHLREWLIKPERAFDARRLPEALRRELETFPPRVRPLVARVAVMRLRQVRLDRHLSMAPRAERRALFRRLFPEPFDPAAAREARRELDKLVAKTVAARVRQMLRKEGESADKQAIVEQLVRQEEERVVGRIRRELRRFRGRGGDVRRQLDRIGYHILERVRLTPRQRELVRYCVRPWECPFLDLDFLGPRPEKRAEHAVWMRDYQTFARLDLLSEARFPREIVLHLSGTASPEDFFRSVKAIFGPH